MKFWVDFEGFCKVEAENEREAEDKLIEILNSVPTDVEISFINAEKDEGEE
jgi:hypothetical protein